MFTSANKTSGQCGKGRLAGVPVRCSQNLTDCVSASSTSMPFGCVFLCFLGIPAAGCVSNYHVDLYPRGTDIDYDVMWSCACDGGVLCCEHCQWVVGVPKNAGIEPEFDIPCRKGVGVGDDSAIVSSLSRPRPCPCSAPTSGASRCPTTPFVQSACRR